MKQIILSQGAEAIILKVGDAVTKRRSPKSYRHPEIDSELSSTRAKNEFRILKKLHSKMGHVPKPIAVDEKKHEVTMQFLDGLKVRDVLMDSSDADICKMIGALVSRMHQAGVIHGDLTTSNFILVGREVYAVDFGLSYYSQRIEDMAVDLHLFRQAVDSKHSEISGACFKQFLLGYKENNPKFDEVHSRFLRVQERGRNKKK